MAPGRVTGSVTCYHTLTLPRAESVLTHLLSEAGMVSTPAPPPPPHPMLSKCSQSLSSLFYFPGG